MVITTRSRSCALRAQHAEKTPLVCRIKQEPDSDYVYYDMPGRNKKIPIGGPSSPPARNKVARKGIRPVDRQKMKDWLVEKLRTQELPQHLWWEEEAAVFCVKWPHAAKQGFDAGEEAKLWKKWAVHSGIYDEGDKEGHKKWKSNFRCAIHSLPDVEQVKAADDKKMGVRRYRILDKPREKKRKGRKHGGFIKQEHSSCSSGESSESDGSGSPVHEALKPDTLTTTCTSEVKHQPDVKPSWTASNTMPSWTASTTMPSWTASTTMPSVSASTASLSPTSSTHTSINIPDFNSLGVHTSGGQYEMVNTGFQSGATFISQKRPEPECRPVIVISKGGIIQSVANPTTAEQLFDDIIDFEDISESMVKEEEEEMICMMRPVGIVYTSPCPAPRTRTPSGDSGHPDSPQSSSSSSSFGVQQILEIPEDGATMLAMENDEGVELSVYDDSQELLDISTQYVPVQGDDDHISAHYVPVQVQVVDTTPYEYDLTSLSMGFKEEAMETTQ